jgi:hypothetical protein
MNASTPIREPLPGTASIRSRQAAPGGGAPHWSFGFASELGRPLRSEKPVFQIGQRRKLPEIGCRHRIVRCSHAPVHGTRRKFRFLRCPALEIGRIGHSLTLRSSVEKRLSCADSSMKCQSGKMKADLRR